MSTISPGARPPQLDDPDWLRRNVRQHGQMWIALELHVSRKVVRSALERHSIESPRRGRRRGSPHAEPKLALASELIPDLIQVERTLDLAPSLEFLLERVGAVMRAHYAGETRAESDALLSVASIAGIRHDHLQAFRAA